MKRLMTETDCFWMILDRVILYLIGWADRLADGPIGLVACGVDYSASVSTPRWQCAEVSANRLDKNPASQILPSHASLAAHPEG
jgi:hypothetical protein